MVFVFAVLWQRLSILLFLFYTSHLGSQVCVPLSQHALRQGKSLNNPPHSCIHTLQSMQAAVNTLTAVDCNYIILTKAARHQSFSATSDAYHKSQEAYTIICPLAHQGINNYGQFMHRCLCQSYKVLIITITQTDEEPQVNVKNMVLFTFFGCDRLCDNNSLIMIYKGLIQLIIT